MALARATHLAAHTDDDGSSIALPECPLAQRVEALYEPAAGASRTPAGAWSLHASRPGPCWDRHLQDAVVLFERSLSQRLPCATIQAMANSAWQTHWHKHPGVRSGDQLSRGERAADRMRNMMGSWPFVFAFFADHDRLGARQHAFARARPAPQGIRPVPVHPVEPVPVDARRRPGGGPADRRQTSRRHLLGDRHSHRANNTDDIKTLIAENTALTAQVKKNTDLLDEIHLHVANIGKKVGAEMGGFAPGEGPSAQT